jgi:hypothetical protein
MKIAIGVPRRSRPLLNRRAILNGINKTMDMLDCEMTAGFRQSGLVQIQVHTEPLLKSPHSRFVIAHFHSNAEPTQMRSQ